MSLIFVTVYIFLIIISISAKLKNRIFYIITKPLPLLFLILILYLEISLKTNFTELSFWILSGLILGLLGDVFLLFSEKYFKLGLFSFLLGHFCYILAFIKSLAFISWMLILPIILFSSGFCWFLVNTLISKKKKSYVFPVIMYIGVLSAMIIYSINIDLVLFNHLSFFAWGGILFGISDTLLSWNRFVKKIWWLEICILSSYYLAQGFITTGCIAFILT